ncbi:membrane protein DedA, SNARE-associated domain [Candidatus Kryptobacter tengchongensis]|uniref:Membrane protein DedA, SNARE-associated domain n=2 Tax=Kryptobacter tengchongensis TaxID=1643429 RepID=A0A916LJK7_KRYT1|nr:VTT domain-containing protein [Candidatus Kryptobacter tengchongensis]CUS99637.1 membrane protein DedA, SNARE-associated domain [Candidatus Kryptobacter tengchongensis]CUU02335.1 membrane protein DedA, SNARE-associated domain [Candidatus Kryptobacter tengchongensis]CUU02621.1 membrane protein DedA, SNARE-associated domain [Candidatus Kryptobacter tengchongensis]
MTSYLTIYIWISLGIVFQGEVALLGAGHLIYAGSVNFWIVILIATFLSFINGEIIFILSKTGLKLIPIPYEKIFKAGKLVEQYKTSLLLFSRFIYGVRNIIPAAFGLTDIKHAEFSILNFAGAFIWAVTFTTVGLFSGGLLSNFIDVKRYQMLILGIFLGIAFTSMMFKIIKSQKQK